MKRDVRMKEEEEKKRRRRWRPKGKGKMVIYFLHERQRVDERRRHGKKEIRRMRECGCQIRVEKRGLPADDDGDRFFFAVSIYLSTSLRGSFLWRNIKEKKMSSHVASTRRFATFLSRKAAPIRRFIFLILLVIATEFEKRQETAVLAVSSLGSSQFTVKIIIFLFSIFIFKCAHLASRNSIEICVLLPLLSS